MRAQNIYSAVHLLSWLNTSLPITLIDQPISDDSLSERVHHALEPPLLFTVDFIGADFPKKDSALSKHFHTCP